MLAEATSAENLARHAAILAYVRAARRLSQLARQIEPELRHAAHDLPQGRRGAWLDFVLVKSTIDSMAGHCDSLVDHSPLVVMGSDEEIPFPWCNPNYNGPEFNHANCDHQGQES
jgi:hypothetical protein